MVPGGHGDRLMDLLFVFAHWHALAKLRLHTDATLSILDDWTTILGEESREFAALTSDSFQTKELRREYEARKRRQARASTKKQKKGRKPGRSATQGSTASNNRVGAPSGGDSDNPGPSEVFSCILY